jgi:hypothetical protein
LKILAATTGMSHCAADTAQPEYTKFLRIRASPDKENQCK